MHLTLRQLAVFESVARHLNYTRAADEMYLSQPAVSMQIRQLEDAVGLPLFERLGRKIHMTEAGRELYYYAQVIGRQLKEAEEVLGALKGLNKGRLAVSVASTANYFATRLLAAFKKEFEGVAVSLDVTNRRTLLRQLEHNEVDLVIMGRPPEDADLVAEPFMDNPLVVIAPAGHALAGQREIPMARLADEPFVVRERGSGTRIAMEKSFAEQGRSLKTGMEMTSNEAIKQAVEAGLGLGIVSLHTLELELATGRLAVLDVEGFPIMRQWHVVHRREKRLSPIAVAFRDFVFREAQRFVRLPQWQSA
jgi:LysR family transcriptional regulator, low CO2-responsive transcriptional regulator